MRSSLLLLVVLAGTAAGQSAATKKPVTPPTKAVPTAKAPAKPAGLTTLSGVYTKEEADAGSELYAGLCASCHTAISHTGAGFKAKWAGRPLSELFDYMKTQMPKNDPASLADEDYAVLLAYMLQMNRMPAGKTALSTDPAKLAKIRIDTARTARK